MRLRSCERQAVWDLAILGGLFAFVFYMAISLGQSWLDTTYLKANPYVTNLSSILNWDIFLLVFVAAFFFVLAYSVSSFVMDYVQISAYQQRRSSLSEVLGYTMSHKKALWDLRARPFAILSVLIAVGGLGAFALYIRYPYYDGIILSTGLIILGMVLFISYIKDFPRVFLYFQFPQAESSKASLSLGQIRQFLFYALPVAGVFVLVGYIVEVAIGLLVQFLFYLQETQGIRHIEWLVGLLTVMQFSLFWVLFVNLRYLFCRQIIVLLIAVTPVKAAQTPLIYTPPSPFFRILLGLGLFLFFTWQISSDIQKSLYPLPPNFELISHRGSVPGELENSLAGIQKAFEMGASRVEIDLQYTRDAQIVLFHDETLQRLAGSANSIEKSNYAELLQYPLLSGETIPLLETLLQNMEAEMRLNLELKVYTPGRQAEFVQALILLLEKWGRATQVMITSLDYSVLQRVQKISSIPTGMIFLLFEGDINQYKNEYMVLIDLGIDAQAVLELHQAGKKVLAWSMEPQYDIESLYLLGVDGVITDDIPQGQEVVAAVAAQTAWAIAYSRYQRLFSFATPL